MILASLGAFAAGCSNVPLLTEHRPRPSWPKQMPQPRQDYTTAYQRPLPPHSTQASVATPTYQPPKIAYATPTPQTTVQSFSHPNIIKRSSWAKLRTRTSNIDSMDGINRITIHHEGWKVVNFTDTRTTVERLQHIQKFHVKERGWADVGYHYIIDRAGRIWEGRPIKYQGAHVANLNEHNVGIMLLGNFQKQLPTNVQLAAAQLMVSDVMSKYNVPVHRVYTHQELKPTQCPGRNLQPRLVAMRRSGYLG